MSHFSVASNLCRCFCMWMICRFIPLPLRGRHELLCGLRLWSYVGHHMPSEHVDVSPPRWRGGWLPWQHFHPFFLPSCFLWLKLCQGRQPPGDPRGHHSMCQCASPSQLCPRPHPRPTHTQTHTHPHTPFKFLPLTSSLHLLSLCFFFVCLFIFFYSYFPHS